MTAVLVLASPFSHHTTNTLTMLHQLPHVARVVRSACARATEGRGDDHAPIA